ncbi:Protein IQ-DOMAIN 1 [Acorus calamus]|uniref:Protein IQ-DOMAIN 1 n=1 Tax=Acorus calamus TaxID=4465 RepID=A0AAV9EBL4_ACOCL|nr:Protein IQ-DOMAIN 1 [Acorus calamus]
MGVGIWGKRRARRGRNPLQRWWIRHCRRGHRKTKRRGWEIQRATKGFSTIIESDSHGTVYKAWFPDGLIAAVKEFRASQQGKDAFFMELELLSRMHHLHVIRLRGYSAGHHRSSDILLDQNFIAKEGWCDSVGSVEEIQAKLIKRQEAAAKRERAMAYALSHQWQTGSRQMAAPAGFELDKNNWGWNWLERWMAVRPWENRFLDTNLKDGARVHENGLTEGKDGVKTPIKPVGKKPISTLHHNVTNQKNGPSRSDGSGSSSNRSMGLQATSITLSSKTKLKPTPEVVTEEASSRPSAPIARSHSNPRERPSQPDNSQAKKRLSLPNSGTGSQAKGRSTKRTLVSQTPNARKPTKDSTPKSEAKSQKQANASNV